MAIGLTPQELESLRDIIQTRVSDLGHEIHRTDRPAYRHELEEMQTNLSALLAKLEGTEVVVY